MARGGGMREEVRVLGGAVLGAAILVGVHALTSVVRPSPPAPATHDQPDPWTAAGARHRLDLAVAEIPGATVSRFSCDEDPCVAIVVVPGDMAAGEAALRRLATSTGSAPVGALHATPQGVGVSLAMLPAARAGEAGHVPLLGARLVTGGTW